MKKAYVSLLAGAAALGFAANANATDLGSYTLGNLAVPTMTYGTAAQAAAAVSESSYSGVGSIFISYASTATTGFGSLCTAALINASTVLTAAHCVYGNDETTGAPDPVTGITFYLPSFGDRHNPGVETYNMTAFAYNPGYDDPANPGFGDIGSGKDEALISLDRAAVGHDTYGLYLGSNPLGNYTEVGTGTIGTAKGTDVGTTDDYLKRVGNNTFEHYGDEIFSDVTHGVVLSDFDDGTAAHDVFGKIGLGAGLGVNGEADSSPGDSGGPEFNAAGQIVSTTSFGITGGIFNTNATFTDGFCGTGSIDPYGAGGTTTRQSVDSGNCTNSSVGELAGDTLVSNNIDFINAYLAAHPTAGAVPEPASWAMFIVGFGAVGSAFRRRAKVSGVSYSQAV